MRVHMCKFASRFSPPPLSFSSPVTTSLSIQVWTSLLKNGTEVNICSFSFFPFHPWHPNSDLELQCTQTNTCCSVGLCLGEAVSKAQNRALQLHTEILRLWLCVQTLWPWEQRNGLRDLGYRQKHADTQCFVGRENKNGFIELEFLEVPCVPQTGNGVCCVRKL